MFEVESYESDDASSERNLPLVEAGKCASYTKRSPHKWDKTSNFPEKGTQRFQPDNFE